MKIILSDGTEIKNLTLNGNTLVSEKEVKRSALDGKLESVTYVYDDGTKEEYRNMMLANLANYGEGWLICLAEKAPDGGIPEDVQDKANGYDILVGGE